MALKTYITACPWDLLDGDTEAVLDRLQGALGIEEVAVWAVAPPVDKLSAPSGLSDEQRQGGLMFRPSAALRERVEWLPPVNAWCSERDAVEQTREACAQYGLGLRLMMTATAVGDQLRAPVPLGSVHTPGIPGPSLCLSRDHVQEALVAQAGELADRYGSPELMIFDLMIEWSSVTQKGVHRIDRSHRDNAASLTTCFCDACRAAAELAGVDAVQVNESLRERLEVIRQSPAIPTPEEFLGPLTVVSQYLQVQARTIAEIARRLRARWPSRLNLVERHGYVEQLQHKAIAARTFDTMTLLAGRAWDLTRAAEEGQRRTEVLIDAPCLDEHDGSATVAALERLAGEGLQTVGFTFDAVRDEERLTVAKQAVRFARRTAGG